MQQQPPPSKKTPIPFPKWIAQGAPSEPELGNDRIRTAATEAGIGVCGVTDAAAMPELETFLVRHLQRGHLDGFDWYDRDRASVSSDPRNLHPTARSVIAVGLPYFSDKWKMPEDGIARGRIARYAWGRDYHRALKTRMKQFLRLLEREVGRPIDARLLVDTARTVDRTWAARAGVGWYGKHSCIIVPGAGSWVMLGELIVDVQLQPDPPLNQSCGSCRICLDRCPTGAIVAPYTIDTPKCISFQTIEQRGLVALEVREKMGTWVFGCDVCQEVCPYTGAARPVNDLDFAPKSIENCFPSLTWLLEIDETEFRRVYQGTAVLRTKRSGLARNAAIALGNLRDPEYVPALSQTIACHDEPLVRAHAAWALGRIGGTQSVKALECGLQKETVEIVRDEIDRALNRT